MVSHQQTVWQQQEVQQVCQTPLLLVILWCLIFRYNTLATVIAFNTLQSNLVFGSYLLGVHETIQTNLLPSVSSYNLNG